MGRQNSDCIFVDAIGDFVVERSAGGDYCKSRRVGKAGGGVLESRGKGHAWERQRSGMVAWSQGVSARGPLGNGACRDGGVCGAESQM